MENQIKSATSDDYNKTERSPDITQSVCTNFSDAQETGTTKVSVEVKAVTSSTETRKCIDDNAADQGSDGLKNYKAVYNKESFETFSPSMSCVHSDQVIPPDVSMSDQRNVISDTQKGGDEEEFHSEDTQEKYTASEKHISERIQVSPEGKETEMDSSDISSSSENSIVCTEPQPEQLSKDLAISHSAIKNDRLSFEKECEINDDKAVSNTTNDKTIDLDISAASRNEEEIEKQVDSDSNSLEIKEKLKTLSEYGDCRLGCDDAETVIKKKENEIDNADSETAMIVECVNIENDAGMTEKGKRKEKTELEEIKSDEMVNSVSMTNKNTEDSTSVSGEGEGHLTENIVEGEKRTTNPDIDECALSINIDTIASLEDREVNSVAEKEKIERNSVVKRNEEEEDSAVKENEKEEHTAAGMGDNERGSTSIRDETDKGEKGADEEEMMDIMDIRNINEIIGEKVAQNFDEDSFDLNINFEDSHKSNEFKVTSMKGILKNSESHCANMNLCGDNLLHTSKMQPKVLLEKINVSEINLNSDRIMGCRSRINLRRRKQRQETSSKISSKKCSEYGNSNTVISSNTDNTVMQLSGMHGLSEARVVLKRMDSEAADSVIPLKVRKTKQKVENSSLSKEMLQKKLSAEPSKKGASIFQWKTLDVVSKVSVLDMKKSDGNFFLTENERNISSLGLSVLKGKSSISNRHQGETSKRGIGQNVHVHLGPADIKEFGEICCDVNYQPCVEVRPLSSDVLEQHGIGGCHLSPTESTDGEHMHKGSNRKAGGETISQKSTAKSSRYLPSRISRDSAETISHNSNQPVVVIEKIDTSSSKWNSFSRRPSAETKEHSTSNVMDSQVFVSGKGFKCNRCKKFYRSKTYLLQHLKLHQQKQFVCEICLREFSISNYYRKHKLSHRENRISNVFCYVCKQTFTSKKCLSDHIKKHGFLFMKTLLSAPKNQASTCNSFSEGKEKTLRRQNGKENVQKESRPLEEKEDQDDRLRGPGVVMSSRNYRRLLLAKREQQRKQNDMKRVFSFKKSSQNKGKNSPKEKIKCITMKMRKAQRVMDSLVNIKDKTESRCIQLRMQKTVTANETEHETSLQNAHIKEKETHKKLIGSRNPRYQESKIVLEKEVERKIPNNCGEFEGIEDDDDDDESNDYDDDKENDKDDDTDENDAFPSMMSQQKLKSRCTNARHTPPSVKMKNVCKICDRYFSTMTDLAKHRSYHYLRQELKCKKCEKQFLSIQVFKRHIACHKHDMMIQCGRCEYSSNRLYLLARHDITHFAFLCSICAKMFKTKKLLDKHVQLHSSFSSTEYSCERCQVKFNASSKLQLHMKFLCKHRLKCKKCGRQFCDQVKYDHHRVKKCNDNVRCKICGLEFQDKQLLQAHHLKHSDRFPYKCQHCPRSFSHQTSLVSHSSIHSNFQVLQCVLCNKVTRCRQAFVLHWLKIHEGKKCEICYRYFSPKSEKTRYCKRCTTLYTPPSVLETRQVLHVKSWFACSLCNFSTVSKYRLQHHLKKHKITDSQNTHAGKELKKRSSNTNTASDDRKTRSMSQMKINPSTEREISHSLFNRKKSVNKNYKCSKCKKNFLSNYHLQRHIKGHHKYDHSEIEILKNRKEPMECRICGHRFGCLYSVERHMRRKHQNDEKTSKCPECGKIFFNDFNVMRHLMLVHFVSATNHKSETLNDDISEACKCKKCGQVFRFYRNLYHHLKVIHNDKATSKNVLRANKAEIETMRQKLNQKALSKKTDYGNKIQKDAMNLKCHICEEKFTSRLQLSRHFMTHTGQVDSADSDDSDYPCEDCGRIYQVESSLIRHRKKYCHTSTPETLPIQKKRFTRSQIVNVRFMDGKIDEGNSVIVPEEGPNTCNDEIDILSTTNQDDDVHMSFDHSDSDTPCNEYVIEVDKGDTIIEIPLHLPAVWDEEMTDQENKKKENKENLCTTEGRLNGGNGLQNVMCDTPKPYVNKIKAEPESPKGSGKKSEGVTKESEEVEMKDELIDTLIVQWTGSKAI